MRKTALTILAVTSTMVLGRDAASQPVLTLDLDFSFSEANVGTVTGQIDVGAGSAAVILDSFPAALGSVCSTPCNTTAFPWTVLKFEFIVSNDNGRLEPVDFASVFGKAELQFLGLNSAILDTPSGSVSGVPTFTPVPPPTSPTQLPAGISTALLFEAAPLLFIPTVSSPLPVQALPVPAESTTPLPSTLPLFATGIGALGLLGWRRKRKARVSLLGTA